MQTLIICGLLSVVFGVMAGVAMIPKHNKSALSLMLLSGLVLCVGIYRYPIEQKREVLNNADLRIEVARKEAERIRILSEALGGEQQYLEYLHITQEPK